MKRRTRNYARRQLTWMRKLAGVTVIDRTDATAQEVADAVRDRWLVSAEESAAVRTAPRTDT
jgi:tRNA A37 N6-isopentenylltransferase MiaA